MASTKRASSAWSDLPSDLFCLVLPHLHSLADRVRAGAVCRQWRSAARLQEPPLPPPMPWLALGGGAYLDIVSGTVHKLHALENIPDDACGVGSVDHLLFIMRDGGGCFLADPLSGAVVPLADLAFFLKEQTREELLSLTYSIRVAVRKVVGHWPSSSSAAAEPVVAALICNSLNKHVKTIFVCRAGADTGVSKESYSTMTARANFVKDIAFFKGNLYALTRHKELIVVELAKDSGGGNPSISHVKYVITNPKAIPGYSDGNEEEDWALFSDRALLIPGEVYLIPSGDELLMVRRWFDYDGKTSCFDVYEADLAASPCRWTPAYSLYGRALFLGKCGSKSVPAAGRGDFEPREGCIYFLHPGSESGVYDTWTEEVTQLGKGEMEVPWRGWNPTWVFSDRSASGSGRY
ncbi:unnamed protein product [Urochloa humidicola]